MERNRRVALFAVMTLIPVLLACSGLPSLDQGAPAPAPTARSSTSAAPGPTPGGAQAAAPAGATYTVKKGKIAQSLTAPIKVVAAREVSPYFKVSGQMGELALKVGDQVRQGDIVASLAGRTLEQQTAQAQLDLDTTVLRLGRAKADAGSAPDLAVFQASVDQAGIELQSARLKLAKLQTGPSKDEITVAKGAMEKAEAKVKKAQTDYDAVYWRPDVGSTAQAAALEEATTDYQVAIAAYNVKLAGPSSDDVALAQNDVKGAEISLAKAQAELAQRAAPNPLKSFDIQLAEREVQRAQMNLSQLKTQYSDSTIVAPFTGNVTSIMARPGDPVLAFNPVIRLADPTSLELRADFDDASLARLVVGQKAAVTLGQTASQQLPAAVSQLPSAANALTAGGDRSVLLKLDTPVALAMGAQGSVTLVIQEKDNVLVIPRDALRSSGTRSYVMLQRGDTPQQVDVRTGIQSADMVEIVSGLQEGDQVVGR